MSVEQGLVNLVNSALANSLPGVTGGFGVELPANFISKANPMSWTYRSILSTPIYVLEGEDPLTKWTVQIDCIGVSMYHAVTVANAIVKALSGSWHGVLTDSDHTVVTGIFRDPQMVDGYNPDARNFVRSLEYEVHFIARTDTPQYQQAVARIQNTTLHHQLGTAKIA